jgi:hypothetical protein
VPARADFLDGGERLSVMEKKSHIASKPAGERHHDDFNPEIATRATMAALELIDPNPNQHNEVLEELAGAIIHVWNIPDRVPGPATDKQELREIASALRRAAAALDHPFAVSVIVWDLEEQVRKYVAREPTEDRVRSLRKQLIEIAESAESHSRRTQVRKGPQQNGKKLWAAFFAYHLLERHGVKPTLSAEGVFFQLAATLYEGATGIANVDLSRACRLIFHNHPTRRGRCKNEEGQKKVIRALAWIKLNGQDEAGPGAYKRQLRAYGFYPTLSAEGVFLSCQGRSTRAPLALRTLTFQRRAD